MKQANIVNMTYGSKLYGTATPESDTDYAGIYMPSMRDLLLQKGDRAYDESTGSNHSKNTAEDTDHKLFSLPNFVGLCLRGDTTALDMLHCDQPITDSWIFTELRSKRKMFYSKEMKSYVGYVKNQALKYGMKGDKLAELRSAIDCLECSDFEPETKMSTIWESLPEGEFLEKHMSDRDVNVKIYSVLGKQYEDTTRIEYVLERLNLKWNSYGARAKCAMENDGMDWKAIHHSLRVLYQVRAIFEYGDFHYPLAETDFLMRVKRGDVDYMKEVAPEFDKFFEDFEEMAEKSGIQEEADVEYWDNWLVGVYDKWFNIQYKEA